MSRPPIDPSPIIDVLRQAVPDASIEPLPSIDMPTIAIDREHFLEAGQVLCDNAALQFAFLSDITAVDVLPIEPRYEIVYHFACVGDAFALSTGPAPVRRLRVKVRVHGDDPRMPSATSIWPGAGWPEREVFDLFGIVFEGHPDLRRILMADDWQGHPLRKDYPVQIRKETASTSALQLTAEEFAANVRAIHEGAVDQSRSGPFDRLRKDKT